MSRLPVLSCLSQWEDPMPSSTRPATPGPSSVPHSSKRTMSDPESAPHDSKKARTIPSTEPGTRRDSNRDSKRRRRKKKKAPIVSAPPFKDEEAQTRLDERSRAPLSARNEVIRFTSPPPEAALPASIVPDAKHSPHMLSSKPLNKCQPSTRATSEHRCATPKDKEPIPEPSSSSLEDRVTQLEAELKSKNNLIASHRALLNQVQQAVTCQVCLDLMYKPYALAPCGHLACHSCLVNWFTAPPPDNRPVPQPIMRRKTCPHCRAIVRERPIEIWGVKSIAQAAGKSGLVVNQLPLPLEVPESLDANADPWKDIFPKPGAEGHRGFPWFYPGTSIDDDIANGAPRGEDVGMLDMEDGGIYRCLDCMHEIWGGVCSSCGRVYPGHGPEGDDEEYDNPMGWLEDQIDAEEVDTADGPGWVGLEDGEADDGSADEWNPFDPWRRQLHMFRGPWDLLGTIHVDEEEEDEEEDDMYHHVDDLRVPDEDEDSGNEGYESSFIDDDDGGVEIAEFRRPRFYEVGDGGEDFHGDNQQAHVDPDSEEQEEHEDDGVGASARAWTGRTHVLVSSDEDDECKEDLGPSRQFLQARRQRGHGIVESDSGSDVVG